MCHLQEFALICFLKKWSWRESNPRPNEEAICLLHVYPQTWFSNKSWIRATDFYLSFLILQKSRSLTSTIPDLFAPPDRAASGK